MNVPSNKVHSLQVEVYKNRNLFTTALKTLVNHNDKCIYLLYVACNIKPRVNIQSFWGQQTEKVHIESI